MRPKTLFSVLPSPAIGLAALVWLMSLAYGFSIPGHGRACAASGLFSGRDGSIRACRGVPHLQGAVAHPLPAPERWPAMAGAGDDERVVGALCVLPHGTHSAGQVPSALRLPPRRSRGSASGAGARRAESLPSGGCARALLVWLIVQIPHDGRGDMLQIIHFAATDLLRAKRRSGRISPCPAWRCRSATGLGVWLPYVPLVAFGIDLRVLNLGLLLLMVLMFWRIAGGGQAAARILAVVLFPFLLSAPLVQMVVSGHLWLYWLLVCITLAWWCGGAHRRGCSVRPVSRHASHRALHRRSHVRLGVGAFRWRAALAGGGVAVSRPGALQTPLLPDLRR